MEPRRESEHNITIASGSSAANFIVHIGAGANDGRIPNTPKVKIYHRNGKYQRVYPGILFLAPLLDVPTEMSPASSITIIPNWNRRDFYNNTNHEYNL